jgi:hypothetical protein
MTTSFPTSSQLIGFTLSQRVFARWLDSVFDGDEVERQAETISDPNQKKGG